MTLITDALCATGDVRSKPSKNRAIDTEFVSKSFDENQVVDGVKGGTQIQKPQQRDITLVGGGEDVRHYFQNCRLS